METEMQDVTSIVTAVRVRGGVERLNFIIDVLADLAREERHHPESMQSGHGRGLLEAIELLDQLRPK
jgi:hypothetical protein